MQQAFHLEKTTLLTDAVFYLSYWDSLDTLASACFCTTSRTGMHSQGSLHERSNINYIAMEVFLMCQKIWTNQMI
jgi:hypothetical protein